MTIKLVVDDLKEKHLQYIKYEMKIDEFLLLFEIVIEYKSLQ